ncbi:MAG: DUF3990 domain-containing protein [Bacteroidetes bacterium]|uniref:DUF3990 domain-containing protein n=1 Tax=Candidatus Pullibacteroides excrementavium TaxID=2840905 RepID=A0A9D9DQS2_9BACT|nr:DUF3990 domain-containing protein [Candidatus Pullibacteroides excrementavium]
MILYHGSNIEINEIQLSKGRHGKDFGHGFYLSDDYRQAVRMSENVVRREACGTPIVTKFEFDTNALTSLNACHFDGYTKEWAEFILANRQNKSDKQIHSYDIVIEPIANDAVGVQIRQLSRGFISFDRFLESIKYVKPTIQYFFGTEQALQTLKKL